MHKAGMMARLLTEEAGPGDPGKPQPARKLSFKTRQASRTHNRASKVSVAVIASKFNTIVIDDAAQGRALLRKLSSSQRKEAKSRPVKTRGEGVVKAAIEIFEHHDSEKTSGKAPLRREADSRPKLVVVRKSSSRGSMKSEDFSKADLSDKPNHSSKECTKDLKPAYNSELNDSTTTNTQVKEIKRKPSLKAKPALRHNIEMKQESANSLNQRIAKFNSVDASSNPTGKTAKIQETKKPTFNLNERIAQFSKSESIKPLGDKKVDVPKTNKTEGHKRLSVCLEEKENRQEITKSILRSTKNKQLGLVEQTKGRLATIVQQNNNTNHHTKLNSQIVSDKKQLLIKDKFIVGEKKELKVFECAPDTDKPTELRDEEISRLSIPTSGSADRSILALDPLKHINSLKPLEPSNTSLKGSRNDSVSQDQCDNIKVIQVERISSPDSTESRERNKAVSSQRDSCSLLKSSLKPFSSESPKLEKKTLSMASDPSENIQLERVKPNNSFLWKPASRMSMVTEVPIYDDRPQSQCSDNVFDNDSMKNCNMESQGKETSDVEANSKTDNSLDLDVASSFILEMTEQIERRFSSGSGQDKDYEETDFKTSLEKLTESVVQKNSSFLYGKSSLDDVATRNLTKDTKFATKVKIEMIRPQKVPPPVTRKPARVNAEDSPPQLPEKNLKTIGESNENLSYNPPPIPPSNTKPKLTHTLSEETWLNNCKKILEIPPPLRKRGGESSGEVSSEVNGIAPMLDQHRSNIDKRFSVSQVELLRRMSEMNLSNKRNSLPADSFSLSSAYVEPEEDHYSSIQQETDDQDTYEAIGENNYAEIKDYDTERGENNIYDDVVGAEHEDYYEAINPALVSGQGDSDSSCDQSNSLYGLARPGSLALPGGGAIYQASGGSESSDEWLDLDNSEYHPQSVIIVREKERRGPESWSVKVRKQWSKNHATADGDIRVSSQSVVYFVDGGDQSICKVESPVGIVTKGLVSVRTNVCLCNNYEAQEVIVFLGNEDGSDESPKSYENIDPVDETLYCDDFDDSLSDSSFDHDTPHTHTQVVEEKRSQPPSVSEGIYGLMKQAGQHMRKHWSLGKSLTRMRKNKSASSIQSQSSLGRRGWSFKSRDQPSTAQSTFYLHSTGTLSRPHSHSSSKPDPRRLSTASMVARPTSPPPPPPPPRHSLDETNKRKSDLNNSNNSSGDNEGYSEGQRRLSRNGNSMWYIETSTDSTSEHGSSQGSDLNLRFADEPLYQFYAANIAEMTLSQLTAGEVEAEGEGDGYEEISPAPRPCALDLLSVTHHRSLWCEVPQVSNSGVLDTLTLSQKRLQEAKFEVMTSEASYFKSLTVLDKLFASCPLFTDENILSRADRRVLFGNVNTVRKCSEKLLAALQTCWQDCILLQGLCDAVHDHVKIYRDVYIQYCTNQISMDRTLKHLKQTNSNFSTVLAQLETDPECQSLALYSFLMLPMQRITRLRLLFDTMLSLLEPSDNDYQPCQRTLDILNRCVMECNEGARSQERHEEMVKLSKQLEFPTEVSIPILGQGSARWLVRSGQVTHVNMDAKQTFGRRLSRTGPKFTLFLFTDLLLVTKKKSEESYMVVDHCQRSLLETQELRDFPGNNRCLLQLTLLENADNKTVDMTLSCDTESERQRWLQVLSPPQSEPGETLYEGWDCPQVTSVHSYKPSQPDELPLALGDIVNVLRKTEGWYYGERTRDGEKGWFPGNYTREIATKHVRARHLKQRHRLLQLSADLVQQQRRVKS